MDMIRLVPGCALYLCMSGIAFGQSQPGRIDPQRIPALSPHYEPEHLDDVPVDGERWNRVAPGLHAAFGSTDAIYFRSEVPNIADDARSWQGSGWRGERLNAAALIWSAEKRDQV